MKAFESTTTDQGHKGWGSLRRFVDLTDGLCCVTLVIAAVVAFSVLGWYVLHMPLLR